MPKTVAVAELGERFLAVLDEVAADHVPYVVTREQRPEAVVVPYEEFQRYLRHSESEIVRRFDDARARIHLRTAPFSEDEISADVEAARSELAG